MKLYWHYCWSGWSFYLSFWVFKFTELGIPPQNLRLQIGSPIIFFRNSKALKFCNGTRFIIKKITGNILSGKFQGEVVLLQKMISSNSPIPLKVCSNSTWRIHNIISHEQNGEEKHDVPYMQLIFIGTKFLVSPNRILWLQVVCRQICTINFFNFRATCWSGQKKRRNCEI